MRRYRNFQYLKDHGIVNNRVTLKRWIDSYGFPAGVKLGPNTRAWLEEEIDAWLAERARATAESVVAKEYEKRVAERDAEDDPEEVEDEPEAVAK